MSLDSISLGLTRRYLRAHHWKVERLAVDPLELFVLDIPNFGRLEIVLPNDPHAAQTDRRISDAVDTLAALEKRPREAVIESVIGIGFDVVLARLPDNKVFRNSISLKIAESFIQSEVDLLTCTADAEIDLDGEAYVESCKFGHTFPGSFGFRVMSPVSAPPEGEVWESEDPVPVERRVIERLGRGLMLASRLQLEKDPSPMLQGRQKGFNSGACEALAELLESSEAQSISFNLQLSPEWRSSSGLVAGEIELRSSSAPLLKEIAKSMRPSPPSKAVHAIKGRIIRMTSKNSPADLIHPEGREITIRWDEAAFDRPAVRVRLNPEQYLRAVDAHKDGRFVVATGLLDRAGKSGYRIHNLLGFEV